MDVLMETLSGAPVLRSFPRNLQQHDKLVKDNIQVECRSRRTRQSVNLVAKSIVINVIDGSRGSDPLMSPCHRSVDITGNYSF